MKLQFVELPVDMSITYEILRALRVLVLVPEGLRLGKEALLGARIAQWLECTITG